MIAGINSEKLKILCSDIQDYSSRLKNNLNSVNDIIEEASVYYSGDSSYEYKDKYNNLKTSINNVSENIDSYIDDLNYLEKQYKDQDFSESLNLQNRNDIDGKVKMEVI